MCGRLVLMAEGGEGIEQGGGPRLPLHAYGNERNGSPKG